MTQSLRDSSPVGTALVTGASGQDGFILVGRLLAEGMGVHAVVRRPGALAELPADDDGLSRLFIHVLDIGNVLGLQSLVRTVKPDEIYNLAGQSSVSRSFDEPAETWRTNVDPVLALLEVLRDTGAKTRLYQSSSSEMFGGVPGASVVHDESSQLQPQSPYAAAKAAAHLACRAYREAFGVRVACGILFNHESRRRAPSFLSRKVADHVTKLGASHSRGHSAPLRMGNLKAKRDWGFAPDYVDGIIRVARQVDIRAEVLGAAPEPDMSDSYRDYVLGTGELHAVWELVDEAFRIAGYSLIWQLESDDPLEWRATFREDGRVAVEVDATLLRPADPVAVQANPALARRELAWRPRHGLSSFLSDMVGVA